MNRLELQTELSNLLCVNDWWLAQMWNDGGMPLHKKELLRDLINKYTSVSVTVNSRISPDLIGRLGRRLDYMLDSELTDAVAEFSDMFPNDQLSDIPAMRRQIKRYLRKAGATFKIQNIGKTKIVLPNKIRIGVTVSFTNGIAWVITQNQSVCALYRTSHNQLMSERTPKFSAHFDSIQDCAKQLVSRTVSFVSKTKTANS